MFPIKINIQRFIFFETVFAFRILGIDSFSAGQSRKCNENIRNKSGKVAFMDNYSDSELKEKLLNREVIYDGKYPLWMDELQMPDGRIIKREHLHHPGGVAILAADDSGKIAFVKQYRYPIEQVTEEIPAGKLDKIPDEDPIHAANRELREETGFTASEIIPMGYIYPSPGVSDEILHLFFARSLVRSQQELDDDEFINVEWIPIDEIERRIVSGEMSDTKGIVAFARAKFSGLI